MTSSYSQSHQFWDTHRVRKALALQLLSQAGLAATRPHCIAWWFKHIRHESSSLHSHADSVGAQHIRGEWVFAIVAIVGAFCFMIGECRHWSELHQHLTAWQGLCLIYRRERLQQPCYLARSCRWRAATDIRASIAGHTEHMCSAAKVALRMKVASRAYLTSRASNFG